MSDPLVEIFGVIVGVAIVATLIETGRPTAKGWVSIIIGLALVATGAAISGATALGMLDGLPLFQDVELHVFLRDMICLVGGGLFLVVGLLRRVTTTGYARSADPASRATLELSSVRELLNSLVRSSINGIMILKAIRDRGGVVVDLECRLMNKEAEQLLGWSGKALVGEPILKHLPCIKSEGLLDEAISVIETGLPYREERYCAHRGTRRWYQIVAVKHGDSIVTSFADMTDRRRSEDQLRHAAEHDTLTGLPNRALFGKRLEKAINRAKRWHNYKFAVLYLDCDRFKIINDSLGHEVGDQLLMGMSERLRKNLRTMDTPSRICEEHLPARLGGDEFAILLDDIGSIRDAIIVAERLLRELSVPHKIGGHEVTSTTSIGIVTSDGNYDRPDDVLRDVDTAMYQAKNSGRARYVVFNEAMHKEVVQRLNLEKDLRRAVKRGEFVLVYQPIVSLETGELAGFEALVRWTHPKRGIVRPDAFIALAEELGLILPLGTWVLREACLQLRSWQERFTDYPHLSMSVNLSKRQVTDAKLVGTVAEIIKDTKIEPRSLRLEITESTIVDDIDGLMPALKRLKGLGVQLAMDDFGTGQSSLGFLHRIPMDILKIDRSFIDRAGKTRDHAAIIHTVVQLAHNLNMEVVAEGVETRDQISLLQSLECDYGQGYLFGEPVSAEAVESLVKSGFDFGFDSDPPESHPAAHVA